MRAGARPVHKSAKRSPGPADASRLSASKLSLPRGPFTVYSKTWPSPLRLIWCPAVGSLHHYARCVAVLLAFTHTDVADAVNLSPTRETSALQRHTCQSCSALFLSTLSYADQCTFTAARAASLIGLFVKTGGSGTRAVFAKFHRDTVGGAGAAGRGVRRGVMPARRNCRRAKTPPPLLPPCSSRQPHRTAPVRKRGRCKRLHGTGKALTIEPHALWRVEPIFV